MPLCIQLYNQRHTFRLFCCICHHINNVHYIFSDILTRTFLLNILKNSLFLRNFRKPNLKKMNKYSLMECRKIIFSSLFISLQHKKVKCMNTLITVYSLPTIKTAIVTQSSAMITCFVVFTVSNTLFTFWTVRSFWARCVKK